MRIRRARPEDLAAAGEVTLAAYADFTEGDADDYVEHLRDTARRDREAEVWVATPDELRRGPRHRDDLSERVAVA